MNFINEEAVEMSEQGIVLKMADGKPNLGMPVYGFTYLGFGESTSLIKPPSIERFAQVMRGESVQLMTESSWLYNNRGIILVGAGLALAVFLIWWFRSPGSKPNQGDSPPDSFTPPSPPEEGKRSTTYHQRVEDDMHTLAAKTPPGRQHNPDSLYDMASDAFYSPPALSERFRVITAGAAASAVRLLSPHFVDWNDVSVSILTIRDLVHRLRVFQYQSLFALDVNSGHYHDILDRPRQFAIQLSGLLKLPLPASWCVGLTRSQLRSWALRDVCAGRTGLPSDFADLPPLLQIFSIIIRISCLSRNTIYK